MSCSDVYIGIVCTAHEDPLKMKCKRDFVRIFLCFEKKKKKKRRGKENTKNEKQKNKKIEKILIMAIQAL